MTAIYLYDDERARQFEPFALTRPLSEMMAGAALQRERWQTVLQLPVAGILAANHLEEFDELSAPPVARGVIPAGSIVANSRFVPRLSAVALPPMLRVPEPRADASVDLWIAGGRAVAARTSRELPVDYFADGRLPLDETARSSAEAMTLDGWWLDEVWDLVNFLPQQLTDDIAFLGRPPFAGPPGPAFAPPPAHATVIGDHPVVLAADRVAGSFVVAGATVEPHVVFDATAGPIFIGAGSTIHAFTRLIGPCYVGRQCTILGDRVAVCSIGDVCKVRGEVSNTIFLGHSNKAHDGFVGHSYLGRWVNLGAGTITSNLKNTYGSVSAWTPRGMRDTGLQFLGTLFGDHAKTGIGTSLTTGTVLGAGANVYGSQSPPKVVAPFSWGAAPPYEVYRLEKFVEVAERVMSRRHVKLSERSRRQLTASHVARWTVEPDA